MKALGIVRKLDSLGRISLPAGLRRTHQIKNDDNMEFYVDNNYIILRKHSPVCLFCRDNKDIVTFKGRLICKECLSTIRQLVIPQRTT